MKKILLILLILSSSFSSALFAQTPTPAPTGAPASAQAVIKLPPETRAAFVAGQIMQQLTTVLNESVKVLDNGVPAQGGDSEIPAKSIQTALGKNVMLIRAALALFADAPVPVTPTPTPAAKKK
jgi:hypothetical protein